MSKLTDELNAMGFRTTRDLARLGPARYYIDYRTRHAHAHGYSDHRITVYFLDDDGSVRQKELRPNPSGTAKEVREKHLAAAVEFYDKRKDTEAVEWVRSPFTEGWYWLPRPTYDHVMSLVKARRAEQKEAAKAERN